MRSATHEKASSIFPIDESQSGMILSGASSHTMIPHQGLHTLADLLKHGLSRRSFSISVASKSISQTMISERMSELRHAGVRSADIVAIEADSSTVVISTMLASWVLGAGVCPIDPSAAAETIHLLAVESGASTLVHRDGSHTKVPQKPALDDHQKSTIKLRHERLPTGVDLALIIFTSGSSGRPKGVRLTHANVLSALSAISSYQSISSTDRILCALPLHFDYGLYQLLLAVYAGARTIIPARLGDPLGICKSIERERVTMLPVVPALAASITRLSSSFGSGFSSVRIVTNTGGHLPTGVIADLRLAFPMAQIMPMYGLTESKRALYMPAKAVDEKPGSVGIPMPGMDARVFVEEIQEGHQTLREAEPNEIGELHVRGATVMQGYHSGAVNTGAKLICGDYRDDNWLATGDLFCVDADGYFYFRGRRKDVIKQSGNCLYAHDIEELVEDLDYVRVAIVVGLTLSSGDESAILFVESAGGDADELQSKIVQKITQILGKNSVPRATFFTDTWPTTSNGKIDRGALCRTAAEHRK